MKIENLEEVKIKVEAENNKMEKELKVKEKVEQTA